MAGDGLREGSQSCFVVVHTVRTGAGKCGSAKAPTATLTMSGRRSFSQKTVEPHLGQKWKASQAPLSAWRRKVAFALDGGDLPAREEGAGAEQRAGAALAGQAMARRYDAWRTGRANAQLAAGAGGLAFDGFCHADSLPPIGLTGEPGELPTIAASFNESWEHRKIGKKIQAARRADHRDRRADAGAVPQHQLLYVGWQPGSSLSLTGYIAMALGLLAAILLGIGLALLIHHDKHRD